MAFCTYCGANLQSDDRFCAACGRAVGQAPSASPPVRQSKSAREGGSWWGPILVVGALILLVGLGASWGIRRVLRPDQADSKQKETPELSTHALFGILTESYVPNPITMEGHSSRENIFAGRWLSFRQSQTGNCGSAECYYLSFRFDAIDAQGKSHEVENEWDIDATQHTATPRNPQARYYWMHK